MAEGDDGAGAKNPRPRASAAGENGASPGHSRRTRAAMPFDRAPARHAAPGRELCNINDLV